MSQQLRNLETWIQNIQGPEYAIYAKYLSSTDTGATNSHNAGPYMPKDLIFSLFPSINQRRVLNPRHGFTVQIPSHPNAPVVEASAIWYNNRLHHTGTRNEARVTGWGGARRSPMLDPDNTGALAVFAFHRPAGHGDVDNCSVWIATTDEEQAFLEDGLTVDPGHPYLFGITGTVDETETDLSLDDLPAEWLQHLPTGAELVNWVVARTQDKLHLSPDDRLVLRRKMEFDAFRLLENEVVLPRIQQGFTTVEEFLQYGHSVSNRRKSRSGTSLELHLEAIFQEERVAFTPQAKTEGHKTPDFLFPSEAAYADAATPAQNLRMLGVKTTVKDRWRQILNEADRLRELPKHLFTLQEGVSGTQHQEMVNDQVVLVVPASLHDKYPEAVREHLLTLAQFIEEMKGL